MPERLFLSYARNDDQRRVLEMQEGLTAAGYDVWRDMRAMPSRGLSFLEEIRRAVRGAERVVLALGPAAARSRYVRMEWQYALGIDKIVVPVLLGGDRSIVPAELAKLHTVSFAGSADVAELVRVVGMPAPSLGTLHGVPQPPPRLRPRPDLFSALAAAVLADHRAPVVLDAPGTRTAVVGMGGAGKSVLAAALARSVTVRRTFTNGVHWFASRPGTTGDAVRDTLLTRFAGAELGSQACLVVLDDVESVRFAEPVAEALGPDSRLMVTTRDRRVADGLGAEVVVVGDLGADEAEQLLADWAGTVPDGPGPDVAAVVELTGRNAFALSLAGAYLGSGTGSVEQLVAGLRAAEPGFLDRESIGYDHAGVLKSLHVSVERIDEDARAALLDLVMLPRHTDTPTSVVQRLWSSNGRPPARSTAALAQLAAMQLVRIDDDMVSLHDLQHLYLRSRVPDATGVHARLLDSIGPPTEWDPEQTEDYFYAHLSHHLIGAGRAAGLAALLTLSPDWLRSSIARLRDVSYVRTDSMLALTARPDALTSVRLETVRRVATAEATRYSAAALRFLVRVGQRELARSCARFGTFNHRYAVLDEDERVDDGFLREVLDDVRLTADPALRAGQLAALGALVPVEDELGEELTAASLEAALTVADLRQRDAIMRDASNSLAGAGRFDHARRFIEQIAVADERAAAVGDQAIALAEHDRIEDARALIDGLGPEPSAWALAAVVGNGVRLGADTRAERARLRRMAGRRSAGGAAVAADVVAIAAVEADRSARALRRALRILDRKEPYEAVPALSRLAGGLARDPAAVDMGVAVADWWDQRLRASGWDRYPVRRAIAEAYATAAVTLVQAGRLTDAQELADRDRSDLNGSTVLDVVALEAARTGHTHAHRLFQAALARRDQVHHVTSRPRIFGDVALRVPRLDQAVLDLAARHTMGDPRGLADLVRPLVRTGRFDEAVAIADQVDHSRLRAGARNSIVVGLADAGQDARARELIARMRREQRLGDIPEMMGMVVLGDALARRGWDAEAESLGTTNRAAAARRTVWVALAHDDLDAAENAVQALDADERSAATASIALRAAPTDRGRARRLFTQAIDLAADDRGLLSLVAELVPAGFTDLAEDLAKTVGASAERSMVWSAIAKLATENSRPVPSRWLVEADSALRDVVETERDEPLRWLANARATAGLDPIPTTEQIRDRAMRDAALTDVAGIHAHRGELAQAVAAYPVEDLESFLEFLLGSSLDSFTAAAAVAGWVSPAWMELATLLAEDQIPTE